VKLGLGSYTFRWSIGHKGIVPANPMTAFDLLDIASRHGLCVMQYADNLPLHQLSDADLDGLAQRARDSGIALEVGTQPFGVANVARYIAIGKRLDARILRVALDGPDAARPIDELAAEFAQLLPMAKDAGIRIAVENHFNFPSRRLVDLLAAIDDDQVAICLDVANSICAGEWPMETVGILAPHAINLHLKDYVIVPDAYGVGFAIHGCPLGQGRTDFQAILNAAPYPADMSVILEQWLPRCSDMDAVRRREHGWLEQSVAFARRELHL